MGIGEAHRAGKTENPTGPHALPGHLRSGREAVEDHRLRGAFGAQHVEHFGVGVAVVDHQRLAGALGQVDMPGERFALVGRRRAPVQPSRPVQVNPRLADRHHPRVGGQPLEFGPRGVGQRVGTGGMQRHCGKDPIIGFGSRRGPAGRIQIVGDGHHCLHADRPGTVQDCAHIGTGARAAGIEVGVGVDQGGQRLRRWRCRTLGTHRNTIR